MSRIFLEVGLGFHAEFTLEEAEPFLRAKLAHLAEAVAKPVERQLLEISARVAQIRAGLDQLQALREGRGASAPEAQQQQQELHHHKQHQQLQLQHRLQGLQALHGAETWWT